MRFRFDSSACKAVVLAVACGLLPAAPFAQPGHRGHPAMARHPVTGRVAVNIHGRRYFYHEGYFYRWGPRGYFVVDAPFGVVVPFLPLGAVRLHFGPDWFFYYGGAYYEPVPDGYVVVQKPDTVYVPKDGAAGDEKQFVEPKTKTVMVDNSNGSKTPVILEEVDGKWKGPKGEIYDSFPTQEQLHSAYGF